ncbi:hypothetical protein FGB62_229g06 [Gracilaria domingensis]|nr:hypothetical protein FGB62_229g06 [Gracilaria domingensis]
MELFRSWTFPIRTPSAWRNLSTSACAHSASMSKTAKCIMPPMMKLFRARLSRKHVQVFLFLLVLAIASLHIPQTVLTNSSTVTSADVCMLVGINPGAADLWQFSSRSLCLSSNVCFDPNSPGDMLYHSSDLSRTRCYVHDSDFKRTSVEFPDVAILNATQHTCQSFQHQFINCAHGTGLKRAMPVCPKLEKTSHVVEDSVRWLDHLSIVVPDYAFSKNIYHYLNPIADLARTVESIPHFVSQGSFRSANMNSLHGLGEAKDLNIIFHGLRRVPLAHLWKQQLLELVIRQRILKIGVNVNLYFMEDFRTRHSNVCLRNAVLLGRRGHYNVWPFPNKTEVPLHGFSVPLDAVRFKRSVYDGLGIDARLPQVLKPVGIHSVSEPPPFSIGYAKRDGRLGSDGYYRGGAMRKFFEADEEWFVAMLRNETQASGAELIIIPPKRRESLKEQVTDVIRVGFLIGIHGANLVNAIFMHPFGVLMEILPKNATEECYIAGANSGLKYLRMECSKEVDPRQRGVDISTRKDRKRIRLLVKQGMEHLKSIRSRFPEGIPVKYNSYSTYFDILE